MPFSKKTWVDGVDIANAAQLNRIEQGIADATSLKEDKLALDGDVAAAVGNTASATRQALDTQFLPTFAGSVVRTSVVNGNPGIDIVSSTWGVDSTGKPYYNAAGVTAGEEAIVYFNPDSTPALVTPGAATPIPQPALDGGTP